MKRYGTVIMLAALLLVLFAGAGFLYPRLIEQDKLGQIEEMSLSEPETAQIPINREEESLAPSAEQEASDDQQEREAEQAPSFTVYDRNGEAVSLSELYGKAIVVNMWASWCPPCRAELPAFNDAYLEYGDQVVFMMVDLVDGSRETQEIGQEYADENDFLFPVFFDTDLDAAYTYGVYSIPMTLFINADGSIQDTHIGSMSAEVLNAYIDELIKTK